MQFYDMKCAIQLTCQGIQYAMHSPILCMIFMAQSSYWRDSGYTWLWPNFLELGLVSVTSQLAHCCPYNTGDDRATIVFALSAADTSMEVPYFASTAMVMVQAQEPSCSVSGDKSSGGSLSQAAPTNPSDLLDYLELETPLQIALNIQGRLRLNLSKPVDKVVASAEGLSYEVWSTPSLRLQEPQKFMYMAWPMDAIRDQRWGA
ncbi:hypothetical protein VNO77_19472 [Canavalia gladiata]|uniref:Uncharacterized protein n=1 Tax=Canavalia gladiata TaxID=3824 RepID=A0AAN9QKH6_CANGL